MFAWLSHGVPLRSTAREVENVGFGGAKTAMNAVNDKHEPVVVVVVVVAAVTLARGCIISLTQVRYAPPYRSNTHMQTRRLVVDWLIVLLHDTVDMAQDSQYCWSARNRPTPERASPLVVGQDHFLLQDSQGCGLLKGEFLFQSGYKGWYRCKLQEERTRQRDMKSFMYITRIQMRMNGSRPTAVLKRLPQAPKRSTDHGVKLACFFFVLIITIVASLFDVYLHKHMTSPVASNVRRRPHKQGLLVPRVPVDFHRPLALTLLWSPPRLLFC